MQYIVKICAQTQKLCGKTWSQTDQLHKQKSFCAVLVSKVSKFSLSDENYTVDKSTKLQNNIRRDSVTG